MPPDPARVFAYPAAPHARRHGPRGYAEDENYKPWLRDEFDYRCVYCLCREIWFHAGHRGFSVEHLVPLSEAPPGLTEYDTLAYACCQCNSTRGVGPLPLHPADAPGEHLEVLPDGTIRALTLVGAGFIRLCDLQRPDLVSFRRRILDTIRILVAKRDPEASDLLRRYLAYPDDLPDLSSLHPPGGNSREEGKERSAFVRRRRGELPPTC